MMMYLLVWLGACLLLVSLVSLAALVLVWRNPQLGQSIVSQYDEVDA